MRERVGAADGSEAFAVGQHGILERIAGAAPLPEILAALVRLIERQAEGMLCSVLLLDAEHLTLHHGAAPSLPAEFVASLDGSAIGPTRGSCGAAAHFQQRVIVEDIASHPFWVDYRELALRHGLRACWSTPIMSPQREVLGTFAMYHREVHGPTQVEIEWVGIATHLAAVAILRERAEHSLRQSEARARQLARLYAVSSSVNEVIVRLREPQQLYEVACRIAVDKGLARLAWVGSYDVAADLVRPIARFGRDDGYLDTIALSVRDGRFGRGPASIAVQTGAPSIANDVASDPEFHWKREALERGFRACAAFPLRLGSGARGVLAIYGDRTGFFCEEEVQVLTALADDISFAVASAHAERALREREERLLLLNELSDALRAVADAEQLLPIALRLLGEGLRATRCAYADVADDEDRCRIPYDYTDGCASMVGEYRLSDFGPRLWAQFRRGQEPVVVNDIERDLSPDEAERMRPLAIRAFILCSLVRQGSLRALMAVHNATPRNWTAHEVEIVQEFVERCWTTIERRSGEAKLRQNEALLRIAGRAARLGGWSIDLPEQRVTWSDEVCAIHELPAGTTPSLEHTIGFYALEHQPLLRAAIATCVSEGLPFDLELLLITEGKRRVLVRAIGHAERNAAGTIVRVHGALQDIGERRELEEQLRQAQKMEAVGLLAGGVAHDFNNLLSVILGYAVMTIEAMPVEEPMRADIDEIRKAAERASELTRQLLAFSRQQVLQPRVLDVNLIVAGLERMLNRLVGDDVRVVVVAAPALGNVVADPGQLEQVIMNLVVNARDAMPAGGALTIETSNVELGDAYAALHPNVATGPYVLLTVTDTGQGMDASTRARIFEPFFSTKEKGKGTGLGLSTVWGIITQSGGHIAVRSEPGAGARFEIYLPHNSRTSQELVSESEAPVTVRGSETILVVEDEEQVRAVVRAVLKRAGYDVLEAQNGGEAFLICEQHATRIDLLLTDVVMPRMNGRELAERLTTMRSELRVLYMSGYTERSFGTRAGLTADVAFLQKPFTPSSLLLKVREVLDRS